MQYDNSTRSGWRTVWFGSLLFLLAAGLEAWGNEPTHWAYVKPTAPSLPTVERIDWGCNPIDHFVLARVEAAGLQPSPPATAAQRLRRMTFDLIGLPPTPEQLEAFLADPSPEAYEQTVDRLLNSPRYGEKWARHWLDLARYSDSNGFQADQLRDLWAYRDWVIRAMNADMPFDQFTIEQLAGDLLPEATQEQLIATGFHRTPTCNVEAGVDPEENRTNQVIDRVNTTATVWLGTTLACAQCHDHKYDPFTQKDYFQLYAFFNNTPLEVKQADGVRYDFYGPKIELPLAPVDQTRRQHLQQQWERRQEAQKQALAVGKPQKETDQLQLQVDKLRQQCAAIVPPTTLVMVEMEKPRTTYIFERGLFLNPGIEVEPKVPTSLHAWPVGAPLNRLGLAQWLVDPRNPLVARVTVNRWWAEIFGRGLIRTTEDFGTQGELPSHSALLDWLATEFVRCGWSMKSMHKLIVMSATYQQSAQVSPELLAQDPENILLARGARFRLPAEIIRDNALAICGLLSSQMGGPPVYPPQPAGLWHQAGRNEPEYTVQTGENRCRRGIYVIWRRAAPYPSFVNFDAPDRMRCVAQRSRTNTPLQALTLLNDEVYVECAKALAARVLAQHPQGNLRQQIRYAMRLCVAREPTAMEEATLEKVYRQELQEFTANPQMANGLIGNFQPPAALTTPQDKNEWAAWFCIANILLNLDETITKG
jgi:hypothetical protein